MGSKILSFCLGLINMLLTLDFFSWDISSHLLRRGVTLHKVLFPGLNPKTKPIAICPYFRSSCVILSMEPFCGTILIAYSQNVAKIAEGQAKEVDGELSKSLLENNKCYLLDCGSEVYVWVGRVTQVEERKVAIQAAEEFITSQNRPKSTRVTRLIQGYETHSFKSNFESWPSSSAPSAPEESRGKVAALLKQQGVGLKGLAKASTTPEEVSPLLEENGKIEVWQINGSAKTPVAKDDIGKFYSGDCYIVLYTYHSNEKKEDLLPVLLDWQI
ncbi:hypothetical protein R6Q57_018631 [Mikania cordata]